MLAASAAQPSNGSRRISTIVRSVEQCVNAASAVTPLVVGEMTKVGMWLSDPVPSSQR
jgi:hypothetical protein